MSSLKFKPLYISSDAAHSDQWQSIAVGDLNGDGLDDVVTGDFIDGIAVVRLANQSGTLRRPIIVNVLDKDNDSVKPLSVELADMNNDGNLDIITGSTGDDANGSSPNTISINYGDGLGGFSAPEVHRVDDVGSTAIVDLDGDGLLDVVSVGGYSSISFLSTGPFAQVLYSDDNSALSGYFAGGTLASNGSTNTYGQSIDVVFADINFDGIPDAVTANTFDKSVSVMHGVRNHVTPETFPFLDPDGVVRSGDLVYIKKYAIGGAPTAIASADLNYDGTDDIVTINHNADGTRPEHEISLLISDIDGNLEYKGISVPTYYGLAPSWSSPHSLALGDMDGDNNIDIVVLGQWANQVLILRGDGEGNFAAPIAFDIEPSEAIALGDVNGDGRLDIIASGYNVNVLFSDLTPDFYTVAGATAGNDLLRGNTKIALPELLDGLGGNDRLYGYDGADILYGRAGNDGLNGGLAADKMEGGVGNDVYFVDNIGDLVFEAQNEGADEVRSSISYTLSADVERLVLTGTSDLNGIGNDLVNTVSGNAFANKLFGLAGNDTLYGYVGNDILNGGTGADMMRGGAGDDTYIVDVAGDRLIEIAGEGTDTVNSAVSYVIAKGQSIETLQTTKTNGTDALNLTGNEINNKILGNNGANKIDGGLGADTLYGRSGADTFVFKALADTTVAVAGRDLITDFSHAQGDRIDLHYIDANAGASRNQGFTFIGATGFHDKAGELRAVASGSNTLVSGDVNGDGAADFSILIRGAVTLQAGDFIL